MTTEQLRVYKGCENYSDSEAKEIVESLRIFAKTIIEIWLNTCNEKEDNNLCIKNNKQYIRSVQTNKAA